MKVADRRMGSPTGSTRVGPAVGAHRRGAAGLAIGLVCAATLAIGVLAASNRGPRVQGTTHPSLAAEAAVPNTDAIGSPRGRIALGWIDGLAAGVIDRSDLASRLQTQDPGVAMLVVGTWADLKASGGPTQVRAADRWLDGLAAGLLRRSDVATRLAGQYPKMAESVMAAWSICVPYIGLVDDPRTGPAGVSS